MSLIIILLLTTRSDLKRFCQNGFSALKEFCFDSETTSINPLEAEIVALAFSWEKGIGISYSFS